MFSSGLIDVAMMDDLLWCPLFSYVVPKFFTLFWLNVEKFLHHGLLRLTLGLHLKLERAAECAECIVHRVEVNCSWFFWGGLVCMVFFV